MNLDGLVELFPWCYREDCKEGRAGHHKHIYPHQKRAFETHARYFASIGGVGSGKTVGLDVLGHVLSMEVPGNIGIVCRRSHPKLRDSTQREFMEVIARSGVECDYVEKRDQWSNRIIYPNGSEVWFRETGDIGRWLGPSIGWFLIDEAIEEPFKTFTDLVGRMRLPVASKYLRGLIASNPPDHNHWIAKVFGVEPQGVLTREIKTSRGRTVKATFELVRSATSSNLALPDSYEGDLMVLLDPSEAQRLLSGKFGFQFEGKAVYGGRFKHELHVGEWPLKKHGEIILPMTRGWDFGFHHPAVLWSQIYRCDQGTTHMITHREFAPEDTDWDVLGSEVLHQSALAFKGASFTDVGDEAGTQAGQGRSKFDSPVFQLAKPPFNLQIRYRKLPDVDTGIALGRVLLKRGVCRCGVPWVGVNPACTQLIGALAGGYHYPKVKYGKATPIKPVKDGVYDDPADAFRYTLELDYRLKANDPKLWEDLRKELGAGDMAARRDPDPFDPAALYATDHLTKAR